MDFQLLLQRNAEFEPQFLPAALLKKSNQPIPSLPADTHAKNTFSAKI
jgi:hypothetical protein